jgi:hypothetical protein
MNELPQTPFEIGEEVFYADAGPHTRSDVACPICFGKRSVKLILGNDEQVDVECDFCGHGFDGPRGTVAIYGPKSFVRAGTVKSLEYADDECIVGVDWYRFRTSERRVFASHAEAEARRVELHAECEIQAKKSFDAQLHTGKRKPTWSAGYHRAQIAELKRKLAWHEDKLRSTKPVEVQP